MRIHRRLVAVAAAVAGAAVSLPAGSAAVAGPHDSSLSAGLQSVTRSNAWTQLAALRLNFPTFHPEGLVVTKDRFYLSSTEIIEPTVKYPTPIDGYDRSPGKGVGHVFVIDKSGKLIKDVVLGHDIVYHPGGIDLAGDDLLVPVAQYRPNSTSEIYRIDLRTLTTSRLFGVADHIGGIVYDPTTKRLVGNTWGSRTFYEWDRGGRQLAKYANPTNVLDFQDCQYVPAGKMVCGGITALPQAPGTPGSYELGGAVLIDLHDRKIINEFPFQQWSAAGHVMTRNPVKFARDGHTLTMWAAPDNGEDVAGTQIYTFQTTLTR